MCQPNSLCAGLWVERSGFKTRLGHFVMFLGKTLYFHLDLLHPGVVMGNCHGSLMECWAVMLRWNGIPSRGGSGITPNCIML